MSNHLGFWAGMPAKTKSRLTVLALYLLFSLGVLTQHPILGIVLLVLPVLWTVFSLWLSGETGLGFGPFRDRSDTILGYTMGYLWNRSPIARTLLSAGGIVLVVGGLFWISTEDMRIEAAKPTLTERATTAAEAATEATKDTASGWISTAKGWFVSDEE